MMITLNTLGKDLIMKVLFNRLDRGYYKYKSEFDEAALRVLASGWYTLGAEVENFEENFASFTGMEYCVGMNSGLDALVLAIRALNIGEGDEVLVPANTYIATILAITENGATPVYVEPDEYYNMNPDDIHSKITRRTKAILVVHLFGQSARMDVIANIAKEKDLYLIEDCAQAHGSEYRGKMIGTWGDINCFSFYPTKNMGAFGDAGAVVTNDPKLNEKLRMLRNYGSKIKYHHEILGVNSRLDEIQAALLNVRLKHYSDIFIERNQIAERYLIGINNPLIIKPIKQPNTTHAWHLFVVRVKNRDKFAEYLLKHDIHTQIHYPVLPYLNDAYKHLEIGKGTCPVAEKLADEIISLPIYEGMTLEESNHVIQVVNEYKGE